MILLREFFHDTLPRWVANHLIPRRVRQLVVVRAAVNASNVRDGSPYGLTYPEIFDHA